jgi:group I intron endonuclease
MRILKSHPLLKLVNSYIIDSPQPSNISYLWNFGSLLAFCLIIQIITGVTLAMHYNPSVLEAFNSVEHIMRDVNNGWLIRYLHSNTASAFFFLVYLHMGRGLYYGSYRAPRTLVWIIGTVIFLLMIITGFLGFLTIAQNDSNSSTKQQYLKANKFTKQQYIKVNKFTISDYIGKRSFSTSRRVNSTTNPKGVSQVQVFILEKNLKPVYVYENLEQESIRKIILQETKGLSGIYLILNKVTNDYYIGSASTDRLHKRFANHLINFTGSKVVKNAVRKYKLSNFSFLVLELFPEIVNKENNKKLLDLEDFYLKSLLPNYNILTEAGSSFGYKHSEITRIKMKANYSNERRKFIGNLNKNKNFSEETIKLLREKALQREKIQYSEQGVLNIKKASEPIIVYNLDNTIYGKYSSIVETANNLNCSVKTISRSLNSPDNLLKKRWIVKYIVS